VKKNASPLAICRRIGYACHLSYIPLAMSPDDELKALKWRAHHRGTREADMLIGGFFDAHHSGWNAADRAQFAAMLEEQDADIIAWAIGAAAPPERFEGPMMEALRRLDYIRVAR
jgi:antitoxin CptB